MERSLTGEENYTLQYRIVVPPGEVRVVKAQGEVTFDAQGAPVRMFGTVLGITEQVRAQEEVGQMRNTRKPVAEKNYFILFANPGNYIKAGASVSIVIGNLRMEHIVVQ